MSVVSELLPSCVIRRTPHDFAVEEVPAYPPAGEGEHLFVTFRKVGRTTPDAVLALARALGVDARAAGTAGLKDRHAVTVQTASFPFRLGRDPEEALRLELDGIEVLAAKRHPHKLRPGHLAANRFTLVLRDLAPDAHPGVRRRLSRLAEAGMPNAFGPQRFGREGDNPARVLAWLRGEGAPPRDRGEQRLLFSAFQSLLFNQLLARRVADGTYDTVLRGDLVKVHASGGLFLCDDPARDAARAAAGEVSATGPMFGASMRRPEGAPLEAERAVLAELLGSVGDDEVLARYRHLGEGTRRPLRIFPREVAAEPLAEEPDALRVTFVLPKGGYATTALGHLCRALDPFGPTAPGAAPRPPPAPIPPAAGTSNGLIRHEP